MHHFKKMNVLSTVLLLVFSFCCKILQLEGDVDEKEVR